VAIIFDSQVLNGVLLPIILVLMLLLINRPRLMGKYVNNLAFNTIAWATVVIVGLLTVVSTIQTILAGNGAGG
jgi:Mn2+/Fe2+ NRAMP family transporter